MKKLIIGTLVLASTATYSQEFESKENSILRGILYNGSMTRKHQDNFEELMKKGPQSQSTERLVQRCFKTLNVNREGFAQMYKHNVYSGLSVNNKPAMIFSNVEDNSLASLDLVEAERTIKSLNPQQHIIRHNGEILIAKIEKYNGGDYWMLGPYDGSVPENTPSTIKLTPHKANSVIRNNQFHHIAKAAEKKLKEIANDKNFKINPIAMGACKALASRLGDNDFGMTISQISKKSDENSKIARNKNENDYRSISSSKNSGSSSSSGTNK